MLKFPWDAVARTERNSPPAFCVIDQAKYGKIEVNLNQKLGTRDILGPLIIFWKINILQAIT